MSNNHSTSEKVSYIKLIMGIIGGLVFIEILLFLPAGTFFWIEGWIYLIIFAVFLIISTIYSNEKNPQIIRSRSKFKPNEHWDIIIMIFLITSFSIAFILLGFDAVRFKWSQVPFFMKIIGFIGVGFAFFLIGLVMIENAYASKAVIIQKEKKHKVITTGPYGFVRHPMYVGLITLLITQCFALGSLWSLIPGSISAVLVIFRTYFEDKKLQKELDGYLEYTKKVKYRLIPGI
ncbi:MAG: methyltransferase family protein [Candidatus Helarchaeota archaeon]